MVGVMQTNGAACALLREGKVSTRITLWHADDDARCRELVAQLLNRDERTHCARSFDSAEELLRGLAANPPPQVVLLDFKMTGMTGVEAIAPIKAMCGDRVAVILFTTFSDIYVERQALALGASAFLLKRTKLEDLVRAIQKHAPGREIPRPSRLEPALL